MEIGVANRSNVNYQDKIKNLEFYHLLSEQEKELHEKDFNSRLKDLMSSSPRTGGWTPPSDIFSEEKKNQLKTIHKILNGDLNYAIDFEVRIGFKRVEADENELEFIHLDFFTKEEAEKFKEASMKAHNVHKAEVLRRNNGR